ncbi:MAG TPA: hypothetical protein VKR31_08155 [Rhizomicrobium sp.]|nr:hypothetical protein [Rhizomicrobium sp.]
MSGSFLACAAYMAIVLPGVAPAAADSPPPIGRIDSRAIWIEPHGVDTGQCDSTDDALQRQLTCVLGKMQQAHASPEALAFTRWYAATSQDIGYVSKIRNYGPVSLATVELPLRRRTNAHTDSAFELVNGTPNPVHGDTGCSENDASLLASRDFQRLKEGRPNLTTWEGTDFVSAAMLPGGVQRFVFSCPLGEYHAAAGQWLAWFALDFDAGGHFLGHRLLKISAAGQ